MKLEQAASILGVSLDEITIDGLKQTYKKLVATWNPEKNKDENAKDRYAQICEAYKKLNSVMEGSDGFRGDESHEIAAFMKMFMNMVGISEHDTIPSAMTFGMMFGAGQHTVDEWSTDEDSNDYEDEDEEEDCYEEYPGPPRPPVAGSAVASAPPQRMVRPIDLSNDNPLEPLSGTGRRSGAGCRSTFSSSEGLQHGIQGELVEDDRVEIELTPEEIEKERKLKQAKKRSEKKKKQKEKKKEIKASGSSGNGGAGGDCDTVTVGDDIPDDMPQPTAPEIKRLLAMRRQHIEAELHQAAWNGELSTVQDIFDFHKVTGIKALGGLEELLNSFLLHRCISDSSSSSNGGRGSSNAKTDSIDNSAIGSLAARRISVAKYLLQFRNPCIDLSRPNADGLPVLHLAVLLGDVPFVKLLLVEGSLKKELRNPTFDIDTRCQQKGWTALHYAVCDSNVAIFRLLLRTGKADPFAQARSEKKQTPMDVARAKLKSASSNSSNPQSVSSVVKLASQMIMDDLTKYSLTAAAEAAANGGILKPHSENAGQVESPTASNLNSSEKSAESGKSKTETKKGQSATSTTTASAGASKKGAAKSKEKEKEKEKEREDEKERERQKARELEKKAQEDAAAAAEAEAAAAAHDDDDDTNLISIATSKTAEKKKKRAEKKEKKAADQQAVAVAKGNSAASSSIAGTSTATTTAAVGVAGNGAPTSATKGKKGKKGEASVAPVSNSGNGGDSTSGRDSSGSTSGGSGSGSGLTVDLSSRDEMVDTLLAMGFKESDCIKAVALYGTDIEQALGWLVERPAEEESVPSSSSSSSRSKLGASGSGIASKASGTGSAAAKTTVPTPATPAGKQRSDSATTRSPSAANPPGTGTRIGTPTLSSTAGSPTAGAGVSMTAAAVVGGGVAATTASPSAAPAGETAAQKLQREREEMRRINRAWNAKAEDEKRKMEALRRQQEIDAQREQELQKQIQQQLQLQQQQQREMQQQYYMQMQQQQQHMHPHSRYGNSGYGGLHAQSSWGSGGGGHSSSGSSAPSAGLNLAELIQQQQPQLVGGGTGSGSGLHHLRSDDEEEPPQLDSHRWPAPGAASPSSAHKDSQQQYSAAHSSVGYSGRYPNRHSGPYRSGSPGSAGGTVGGGPEMGVYAGEDDEIMDGLVDDDEPPVVNDGAVELSAVAREFVPKFALPTSPSTSAPDPPQHNASPPLPPLSAGITSSPLSTPTGGLPPSVGVTGNSGSSGGGGGGLFDAVGGLGHMAVNSLSSGAASNSNNSSSNNFEDLLPLGGLTGSGSSRRRRPASPLSGMSVLPPVGGGSVGGVVNSTPSWLSSAALGGSGGSSATDLGLGLDLGVGVVGGGLFGSSSGGSGILPSVGSMQAGHIDNTFSSAFRGMDVGGSAMLGGAGDGSGGSGIADFSLDHNIGGFGDSVEEEMTVDINSFLFDSMLDSAPPSLASGINNISNNSSDGSGLAPR